MQVAFLKEQPDFTDVSEKEQMIDFYSWATPNGRKISIMLEEVELPYTLHPVDITKGAQFKPEFVAISPYSKIPVIVDQEGPGGERYTVFESGAILIYLAEKTGKLMPLETRARYDVLQWLMLQMGGIGPMFGQLHHFRRYAPEKIPYAIERYTHEAKRLYRVLEHRLQEHGFLTGDYSIADIAAFPWAARHEWQGIELDEFPNVKRWFNMIAQRPAVQRGMVLPPGT
jgi:GST-like protein